jgi:hypothetical protein
LLRLYLVKIHSLKFVMIPYTSSLLSSKQNVLIYSKFYVISFNNGDSFLNFFENLFDILKLAKFYLLTLIDFSDFSSLLYFLTSIIKFIMPGKPMLLISSPLFFSKIIISGLTFLNVVNNFSISICTFFGRCLINSYKISSIKNLVFASLSKADFIPLLLSIRYFRLS